MLSSTLKLALATGLAALAATLGTASTSARATAASGEVAAAAPAELAFARGGWIYVVREDGKGLRRLVRGALPAWSPDGRHLAFSRLDRIYVIGADGRGERRITSGPGDSGLMWSPHGRRIAFTSRLRASSRSTSRTRTAAR